MARGETTDTVLVYVYGERVRLATDRPAAYLKMIADVPTEQYVAYRADDRLMGLADTVTVASYVDEGSRIAFQPRDRLATVIDGSAKVAQSRATIYVNGQPVLVGKETTVADLRTAAGVPEHTVAMVRDHDVGQVYVLTEEKPVLDIVQPGDAVAFHSTPDQ